MAAAPESFTADELALLERLAARVVELRLEVPAILVLESAKPVALLAGQAVVFFEPIASALFGFGDLRRLAALLERRGSLERLIQLIERRADEARPGRAGSEPPRPAAGR